MKGLGKRSFNHRVRFGIKIHVKSASAIGFMFPQGATAPWGPLQTVFFAGTPLGVPFFPYHTIRISFNGKGSLCSAMHISHGIIIKRNFARCLPAFYGSGLSFKGMLLRVACFIAHQPGTPRGLTLTLRLNEK